MSLRSSLRGHGHQPVPEKRRVSFCPEVVKFTVRESFEADELSALAQLGTTAHDISLDMLEEAANSEQSMKADEDMEITGAAGGLVEDGDSDMELTEPAGRVLPDEYAHESSFVTFTAAAGEVLEQSMDLTEPLGLLIPDEDIETRLSKLRALKQRLLDYRQGMLSVNDRLEELAQQQKEKNKECRVKHHLFEMSEHIVPLTIKSVTPSEMTIAFQLLDSCVTFRFGEAGPEGHPLPINEVVWNHPNPEHAQTLEQLGVIKLMRRLKHTKQLRNTLQEAMVLVYAGDRLPKVFADVA